MTMPDERTRAVQNLERALVTLRPYAGEGLVGNSILRDAVLVPRNLVDSLLRALRHYPTPFDLTQSHAALPEVWGPPITAPVTPEEAWGPATRKD